jgi:cytochrome P450 / NADPH-cytochrome P450 reductase
MAKPIPQPPAIPFLGNVTAIDKDLPIRSFQLLAKKYGDIYQLNMLGMTALILDLLETKAQLYCLYRESAHRDEFLWSC